VTFNWQKHV